jgi:hypothetical protein
MFFKKKVHTHVLEKIVAFFMIIFGLSSIYIFTKALSLMSTTGEAVNPIVAVIEMQLIVLIALFANIWVTIKVYEQHRP